jgi:lysophospholipase L1-like esterase
MLRRLASLTVAAATATCLLAAPASAAQGGHNEHDGHNGHDGHDGPGYYLALGDSLAYGYQPTQVTGQGYVDQLYPQLRTRDHRPLALANLGCPGETSTSMITGGVCGTGAQLDAAVAFLGSHRVSLVTLDIGANDVDRCATPAGLDQACVLQGLATLADNTERIAARLRGAAPHTTIVAMNYYDPFLASYLTGPAGQQVAAQSLLLSKVFNALLVATFRAHGFRIADVAGAFGTDDFPADVATICQLTWMCAPAPVGPDIHANQQGYAVIAQAFLKQIPNPL